MMSSTLDQESAPEGTAPARVRITQFRPEDAAAVAAMFNESEEGWPGGFNGGVPMTAESVLRRQRDRQPLATFLAWEGDVVAGYCGFSEYPDEPGAAGHIGLLNVATRFQGRGYGRDLIFAAMHESVRRGYRRLDLGTWPGNMKAVPLYKKTGFFWEPDTTVHMRNYMPLLLSLPALADFWREADWYKAQIRDLSVREDLYLAGKIRVYPYEFRHGERFVRAVIDAASHGLTALETEEWRVSCAVNDRTLIRGRLGVIRWELENRTDHPFALTLLAQAGAGLQVTKEETVTVRDRYCAEAPLTVAHDYEPPAFGRRPLTVQSLILLDGKPIRLETGVEVRPPCEVTFEPRRVSLIAGLATPVALRIQNQMDEPATVRLALALPPGLRIVPSGADPAPAELLELPLEAEGYAGVTLSVLAEQPSAHVIEARGEVLVAGQSVALAPIRLPLPALAPGLMLALHDDAPPDHHGPARDREVRVESATWRLVVKLREGAFALEDAATGEDLLGGIVAAGPPFGWTYQSQVRHEAEIAQEQGAVTVRLRGAIPHLPDLVVDQALRLSVDGLLCIETTCTNMAREPRRMTGAVWVWADRAGLPTTVLPSVHGLISTDDIDFPDWGEQALHDPALYAEGWCARQGNGRVVGMLWPAATEIELNRWMVSVSADTPPLAPGETHAFPPVYLFAGMGDWRAVRACWRRLLRPDAPIEPPAERQLVTLRADPWPTAVVANQETTLTLSSLANRAADGVLAFEASPGWTITPASVPLNGLRVGQPRTVVVNATASGPTPGAAPLRATWRTERSVQTVLDGAAIQIGSGDTVRVCAERRADQEVLVVENGDMRFAVTPSFIGSVIELTVGDGPNQILSAFPTPREYGWIRPWYGGLFAVIYKPGTGEFPDPARLYEETFVAEEAEITGRRGRLWRGVRVRSMLRGKGIRGLELGAEYLTVPGSTLLAARLTVVNHTSATLPVQAALVAHLQPGGTTEGAELLTTSGQGRRLLRAQRTEDVPSEGWAGARNPVTGETVVLVDGGAPESVVYGDDWGYHGAHAGVVFSPRLGPGEARCDLAFLVPARNEAEARAYTALAGAQELP